MVHRKPDERERSSPRGRPFAKGNKEAVKKRKPSNKVLDDSGRESSVEGGVVAPHPLIITTHRLTDEIKQAKQVDQNITNITPEILNESVECVEEKIEPVQAKEDLKDLELIDSLEFKNGPNTLSIRFSKKHNRMFRIQVFLNEDNEIRPVTYAGARTGYTFWQLLKAALKKE